jgi:hypothetical protein
MLEEIPEETTSASITSSSASAVGESPFGSACC